MKRTDFTKEQLKLLRENLAHLKACEARGEVADEESTWANRRTLGSYSIKSRPDSAEPWRLLALDGKGQAYGYSYDNDGYCWFEWLSLEELEPLNLAARGQLCELWPDRENDPAELDRLIEAWGL